MEEKKRSISEVDLRKKKVPSNKPVAKKKTGLNGMKRKDVEHGFSVISIMIMLPVFAVIALLLLVVPRSEKSEIEKRTLAKMPSYSYEDIFNGKFFSDYISGEFAKQFTEFYDDTVPDRDYYKTLGYEFKNIFGFHFDEEVKVVGNPVKVKDKNKNGNKTKPTVETSKPSGNDNNKPVENSKADENSTAEESSTVVEQSEDGFENEDISVENGIIVVKQNGHYRALEMFGSGTGNTYVNALNNFHKDLGDSVKIYSMIAPLASQYYTPESHADLTSDQKPYIDAINKKLDSEIIPIDITDVLGVHKNEDIYFRTDHHWTPLGAYYAAQEFAGKAGVNFKDLSTYEKVDIEGFVGTMYAFTKDANINKDPELFTYYKPDNLDKCKAYYYSMSYDYHGSGRFFQGVGDVRSAYMTFMGGDNEVVKVKTNIKNGKRLLIVKDSYGNAIPGYLFGAYEEIYVVDMRYFECNLVDFVKQRNVTDVLFTMVIYSAFGENADNLENLRTQAKGKVIIDGAPNE